VNRASEIGHGTVVRSKADKPLKTFQKPAQGGGVGMVDCQILEDTILLQQNVGFDPSQTKDDRIKDGKDGVAGRVSIVDLLKPNGMGKSRPKLDPLEKLL
jgi:hypothetical protein